MNKTEVIKELSKLTNISQKMCKAVLDNFYLLIANSLRRGEEISFYGIGKFLVKTKKERVIKTSNGNKLICPKKTPCFKIGKTFKNIIN